MASLTTCCHGDEPGTGLGVASGTVGGVCNPKTHSGSVRVQGEWAIRHNDEWWMNNRNTVGKLYWVKTTETPGPTPAIATHNTGKSLVGAVDPSPFLPMANK
ncbi:MAG: DUF4150 domain-containing protein [Rhodospirillales bacterium]|nr:DUF4150 domain-containing protein [Rhodospirillales bacterium]